MNKYLNLIREFALTDFKLKYHGSILGYLWSLLNPLLIFGTLYIVFSIFIRFEVENYHLYLLLGIILWNYFSEATLNSMNALINKSPIIKKIYFPRTIIVLASNITTFIGLILNLVVFSIFMLITRVKPTLLILIFPLILIELILLTLGSSFLLSSLNLRFLDIQHIWRVFLQIGFWLTPIIYPIALIPEKYHNFFLLNPLAIIIGDARNIIMYDNVPKLLNISISSLFSIIIFLIGYFIYKKLSTKFAEW